MKKLLPVLFSFLSFSALATHERAGEITYTHISGWKYEITVTTYTRASSCGADQCSVTVYFGDGDSTTAYRQNGSACPLSGVICQTGNGPTPPCFNCGVLIGPPSDDIKMNKYVTEHTYPGPGPYTITMTDPNRNDQIVNVPNGSPFSIYAFLIITGNNIGDPPPNNSVTLLRPPIDNACAGACFIHNAGAYDPDHDSLSYKLGVCLEAPGKPVNGYVKPTGISIDPYTGNFTWCNPPPPHANGTKDHPNYDEYNFAFDIEEWALNTYNKKRYLVGIVRRDMQVKVYNCQNVPPVIADVNDTCIEANTTLTFTVTVTDAGGNNIQSFTATGGPFKTIPSATFTTNIPPYQTTAIGVFAWTPACNQVSIQPYSVNFRALDDGAPDLTPVPLAAYKTFSIRVIAPAPKNLTLVPQCTNMILRWDAALCPPMGNPPYSGYKIYRNIGCDTLRPGYCETGMPSSWNYSLIATVPNTVTSYTDNNSGNGLIHGNMYSYRVVAYYLDGSESYVSDPVCSKLVRDVPIITNVDVISTGTIDSIHVKWLKPDTADYDTTDILNHGPYRFELLRLNPTSIVQTFSSAFFATLNTTSWLDSPLNTQSKPYTYRINFYDTLNEPCSTQNASSIFLSCNPNDNKIQITWNEHVPWTNYRYDVYRKNSLTSTWDSIGTTGLQTFTDSGLVNGTNYCYKVKSLGAYPDTSLPHPLINWSQQLCCSPVDLIPPCPVTLAVDSSCDLNENLLSWNNPNNSCCDDALYYIVYYRPVEDGDFSVLNTIYTINTPSFLHDSLSSIAGCYAITSVDSFGNESAYSNIVCVDNCPYYQLPNVFTPNGDGLNDFFTPLHPYKYVRDIDIKIYNRWGTEIFRSTNPKILWDGKSVQTKMMCSDGVYYYVCIVNDIRLKGIVPHVLKGNVHLLSK